MDPQAERHSQSEIGRVSTRDSHGENPEQSQSNQDNREIDRQEVQAESGQLERRQIIDNPQQENGIQPHERESGETGQQQDTKL